MSNKVISSPLVTSTLNDILPSTLQQIEAHLQERLGRECPRCHSSSIVRNGHSPQGRQRYKCKQCCSYYTSYGPGKPEFYRKIALQLYLEGLGFRAIGRLLGLSNVTVLCWIRTYGQQIEKPANTNPEWPQIIEFDEIWTFIASKKKELMPRDDSQEGRPGYAGYGSPSIGTNTGSFPLRLEAGAIIKPGKFGTQ